jgi:AcrR family transcriptional regulator
VNVANARRKRAPSSVREHKKQAARAEILGVARALIESKGYRNTRMREIAKAARISYQTLYNYFPAKSMIVQALLDGERARAQTGRDTAGGTTSYVPLRELTSTNPAQRAAGILDGHCLHLRSVVERAFDAAADRQRGLWREVVLDLLRHPTSDYCALTLLVPDGADLLFESVRSAHANGVLKPDCNAQVLARLVCRLVDSNLLQLLVQPLLSRRDAARIMTEQLEMLLEPYLEEDTVEAPIADSQ